MSAVVSSLAPLVGGARRAAPAAAPGSRVGKAPRTLVVRDASLNDKINELKGKVNLPEVPKIDLPNVNLPKSVPNLSKGAGNSGASPGYKPSGGDQLYVGQGKYIPDDQEGFVSKTGRDSNLVGGFAGGEKGLWKYREDRLAEDPAAAPKQWERVYGGRKGTAEVDLAKDFGGMAGGFPGGEVGVKAFNATGNIATRDAPPTIGWGPPVLLLAAIGGTGYYLNPASPEEVQRERKSIENQITFVHATLHELARRAVLDPRQVPSCVIRGRGAHAGAADPGAAGGRRRPCGDRCRQRRLGRREEGWGGTRGRREARTSRSCDARRRRKGARTVLDDESERQGEERARASVG